MVHVKVDLSRADSYYDELFPASMFSEPVSQPSNADLRDGDETSEEDGDVEEAFNDVEEVNPFVGKTQVIVAKHLTEFKYVQKSVR